MCGIFCLFYNRPLTSGDVELGRKGTAALAHRGPDGSGEWHDVAAGVFLGHRRLAIVDPSHSSDQPMAIDGSVLTYNGEVYNFHDVRTALAQAGVHCQTSGDVEVLLRAWLTMGEAVLDRIDGMFAFALWDGYQARIATDPFGEKPLFYAETVDGILFSSEIAPLARLLNLTPSVTGENLAAYLALGFVPPPATAYGAIRKVGPAALLTVRGGRIVDHRTYWTPPVGVPGRGAPRPLAENDLDRVQAALSESLCRRLYADVPMCTFLSRGVDSALVATMAKMDHGAGLESVTVSFPGPKDEAPAAAAIASHIGVPHRVIPSKAQPETADTERMLEIYGQPCATFTALSILEMSTAAKVSYKAGLTGMGGDEALYGYNKFAHFYDMRRLYALPRTVRATLGALLRPFISDRPRLERMVYDICAPDAQRILANKNFPAIPWLRQIDGFSSWAGRTFSGSGMLELDALAFELGTMLPGTRLVTFDHSSMAAGLELRTPFLSRVLFETVASFDPRSLIAFGQKNVGRRLLARYIPKALFNFPKTGFVYQARHILAAGAPPSLPPIPGISTSLLADAWRRKSEGRGWEHIALRLLCLSLFLERAHSAEAK